MIMHSTGSLRLIWRLAYNGPVNGNRFLTLLLIALLAAALNGCQDIEQLAVDNSARVTLTASVAPLPTTTPTMIPTATHTPLPTVTSTITLTPQPVGCKVPPEDYERIQVNGWVLNRRTFAMLENAQEIYGGELEITGYHITQGSYHDNGSASFGTHLGGGAVDLSVMRRDTYTVLWDDIEPLISALRAAGFAAWLRDLDELYPGSPIHIHAIAIGDKELSQPAQDQLTAPYGYFYGFTGLPHAPDSPDRHGGPVLCQWMIDLGYTDLSSFSDD